MREWLTFTFALNFWRWLSAIENFIINLVSYLDIIQIILKVLDLQLKCLCLQCSLNIGKFIHLYIETLTVPSRLPRATFIFKLLKLLYFQFLKFCKF